ncbi:MAG: ABC transporter ATP-binding protein [Ruminococcaceae bacterium]|nr:ABC transporter ATP-binding protein [Oscillospiraceae bacterium]
MLRVDGLCYSYGRTAVLESLSFSVDAGQCIVLAGPNGCGKSTALSLIAGALKHKSGTIRHDGRLGYIPQGTALFEDATVAENLRFFAGLAGCDVPSSLPFSVEAYQKRRVSDLSGGMKKQVSIACALVGDPDLILLDEPCAALDITFRDEMTALVKKWKSAGKTVVYVGHDPAEFREFFDTLLFLGRPPQSFSRDAAFADDPSAFGEFFRTQLNFINRK